jgi:hypothetical protein
MQIGASASNASGENEFGTCLDPDLAGVGFLSLRSKKGKSECEVRTVLNYGDARKGNASRGRCRCE